MLRSVAPSVLSELPQFSWPLTFSPPLPPPPATDWAKMPCFQLPSTVIVPAWSTETSPEVLPDPPKPPTPKVIEGILPS